MQDALPGDELVIARPDVLGVSVDDCLVLYDPRTQRAHVLNAGAAHIWGMLQDGSTVESITAALAAAAPADEVVAADVAATVTRFAREQLIGDGPDDQPQDVEPEPLERIDGRSSRGRSVTMTALERTVAFECDSPDIVAAIEWLAAPLVTREPPGEIYVVDREPARARLFPSQLNRIAAASSTLSVLHAAGVVFDGVVIALLGAPRAGKSTLTTQLIIDGYGYVTDEVLGIAPQSRRVVGFPKRITLEVGSWSLFPQLAPHQNTMTHAAFDPSRVRWVDPQALDANALGWRGRPLELGVGVVANYQSGAAFQCERLDPVEALTALLANSFNLRAMGSSGLESLRGVATSVPFYRMTHGGIETAAPAIRELLASEGVAAPR